MTFPTTANNSPTMRLPQTIRCETYEQFKSFMASDVNRTEAIKAFEDGIVSPGEFHIAGYCAVCGLGVKFAVDYRWCWTSPDGRRVPNWREHLRCPHCRLNNRERATVGFLCAASDPSGSLYLTERVTSLFGIMGARREHLVGSEYLRDGTLPGAVNREGTRHEDVTALSWPDAAFDLIGTFEVLEHVPDYRVAMDEFYRTMRPGGLLVVTVPIDFSTATTTVRARLHADGTVEHLLPPEIHGDPLDENGALCFYNFGWDFIEALRAAGFEDAGVSLFWDAPLGYFGGYQSVVTARRPPVRPKSLTRSLLDAGLSGARSLRSIGAAGSPRTS